MGRIAAIASLAIIGLTSVAVPAPAEAIQNAPVRWIGVTTFNSILTGTTFNAFLRAPRARLSPVEVQQIAFKVGLPLQAGYFTIGYRGVGRIEVHQSGAQISQSQAIAQNNPDTNQGPAIRRMSPSAIDLSGEAPGTRRIVPEEGWSYDPVLRARAAELYPSDRVARLRWMAYQEQQAIQNQINSSKPLIYPVGNR